MTARQPPEPFDPLAAVLRLLGDVPANEVTCEITRAGTIRIVARRGEAEGKMTMRTGMRGK